jgi:hypothetical protein
LRSLVGPERDHDAPIPGRRHLRGSKTRHAIQQHRRATRFGWHA